MLYRDFLESGYKIFGLYGATKKGCNCGWEDCAALFKHPVAANWQHTPNWSEDQLEVMELTGQLTTGYGVLVQGLLVVDVDSKNGGVPSYEKLLEKIPALAGAGMIVNTGSGKGSKHLYFKAPTMALRQTHEDYKGIDFKSSGYVVGPGSMHVSGNKYECVLGGPDEISEAPQELLDLLEKPEIHRAEYNGEQVDISDADIADMLKHIINDDLDYEIFIRIGMAVHSATSGSGFYLWDTWASDSSKYNKRIMDMKWQSFGKSANPVTLGTLVHHAEAGGWTEEVEFVSGIEWDVPEDAPQDETGLPFSIDGVDLLRPPGFVGDVVAWINSQCRYPREDLAVAGGLFSMGNVCGLRYTDDIDDVTANLFVFCVAGSGTGKEAISQSVAEVHRAAGIHRASHGPIKSEQEIIRNLIKNQAAFHDVDEFGYFLQRINNARKHGGASYLDGVIAALMSAYSKANGYMLLTGDTKDDVRKALSMELKQCQKAVGENDDPSGQLAARIPNLERALGHIDNGLEKPFISLMGLTTPETFNGLITREQATNGFIGRSLFINQLDTNPKIKKKFKKPPMSFGMQQTIAGLYGGGNFDANQTRVEYYSERIKVSTDKEARAMLEKVSDWIWSYAELQKETTGLEAIVRRGYEMMAKVSLILAAPSGIRTAEHVRWAFALIKKDLSEKMNTVNVNDEEKNDPASVLKASIIERIGIDHGETLSTLDNRIRKFKRKAIEKMVSVMIEERLIKPVEEKAKNGKKSIKYYLA